MAAIREVLDCRREPSNPEDRYAITVIKDETIIGHLPRKVSRLCSLLSERRKYRLYGNWKLNPWGLGVHL